MNAFKEISYYQSWIYVFFCFANAIDFQIIEVKSETKEEFKCKAEDAGSKAKETLKEENCER